MRKLPLIAAALTALVVPVTPVSAHGACIVRTDGAIFMGDVFANGFIDCTPTTHTRYDLQICIQAATLVQFVSGTYSDVACQSSTYDSAVAVTSFSDSFWHTPACRTEVRHWRAHVRARAGAGTGHQWQDVYSPGSFQDC